jgi:5'-3' exonuclease
VEYKAQREAAPDILRQQMGLVRQVLEALRITMVELPGWEADDVLATVAERAKAEGHEIMIVTGDRDVYQLVEDPLVRVLYNRRGVSDYALYDEGGIRDRTGVTPAQYVDYAALRGDPSDNLPGVPGVGEKTAAKLVTTYGGLDGIFANVDKQTPKLRESLAANEARVRLNRELMILRRDAPVECDLTTLTVDPDQAEVRRLFDFLEFKSLHDRLYEALTDPGDAASAVVDERGPARGGDRAHVGRRRDSAARRAREGGRRAGVGGRARAARRSTGWRSSPTPPRRTCAGSARPRARRRRAARCSRAPARARATTRSRSSARCSTPASSSAGSASTPRSPRTSSTPRRPATRSPTCS